MLASADVQVKLLHLIKNITWEYVYETNERRSKSSRPDLVLFRIKLKYYLLLILARLRTQHAQYDFWAINILCIFAYEHSVCQLGVENSNTKRYTGFWRTSRTIPTWPSKNLFQNSLFTMKRASTISILSQNIKACNETNESVKIVISLHCVTPIFFHVECKQPTTAKMHEIFTAQKSHCACRVLSLANISSKYHFNFILNRTRSGRELFDHSSYYLLIYMYAGLLASQLDPPSLSQKSST